jgi:hypothetical protein
MTEFVQQLYINKIEGRIASHQQSLYEQQASNIYTDNSFSRTLTSIASSVLDYSITVQSHQQKSSSIWA